VVSALRCAGRAVEATWVGAGEDQAGLAMLEAAGVRVTGWLPSAEVAAVLARHSVYLHTATWEAAAPIAVFDAISAGVVVVARRIPAYRAMLSGDWLFDSVPEALHRIVELQDDAVRDARLAEQRATVSRLAQRGPGEVLPALYRKVCEGGDG
jgi:glycosyltransferase involved in cell wall biosynthesis